MAIRKRGNFSATQNVDVGGSGSAAPEDPGDHADKDGDAEQPPIPFHAERAVWRFAELAGAEGVVIEVVVGQVEAVGGFVLLPGFFAGFCGFFLTAGAWLADADLAGAEGTNVAESFGHGGLSGMSTSLGPLASWKNRLAFRRREWKFGAAWD